MNQRFRIVGLLFLVLPVFSTSSAEEPELDLSALEKHWSLSGCSGVDEGKFQFHFINFKPDGKKLEVASVKYRKGLYSIRTRSFEDLAKDLPEATGDPVDDMGRGFVLGLRIMFALAFDDIEETIADEDPPPKGKPLTRKQEARFCRILRKWLENEFSEQEVRDLRYVSFKKRKPDQDIGIRILGFIHELRVRHALEDKTARKHVVKRGETLYSIAKHYVGTGTKWKRILEFNKERLTKENVIKMGEVILIPIEKEEGKKKRTGGDGKRPKKPSDVKRKEKV